MSGPTPGRTARLGLLVCDHLDPEVAEAIGGDYDDLLFPSLLGPSGADVVVYDVLRGSCPTDPTDCDGWVTTGSRFSAYDDDAWIRRLGSFLESIVASQRPLLAVCFGHQLLAQQLGGSVARAEHGWGVGVQHFDVVAPQPWMGTQTNGFDVLASHRDQVVSLPAAAELVARADYCPVGAYQIGPKVLAVQGHPEWTPLLSRTLMERRRAVIAADTIERGLAGLEAPHDLDRLRGWVNTFLAEAMAAG